jgi:hypothetical protein
MKTTSLFLSAACFLVLVASGFAQDAQSENAQPKKSPGILGYLDPKTGAFRILPTPDKVSPELPAVTPTVGKFVFNITIALNPGLSPTAKLLCTATAATSEAATQSLFEDFGTAVATRAGATAKCTITLPYGWTLASPASDFVSLGVQVSSSTGTVPPTVSALSSQSFIIKVPPSGTTTTQTVSTSI